MKNMLNTVIVNRLIARRELILELDQMLNYEQADGSIVNKAYNRRYSFFISSSLIIMNDKL